MNSLCGSSLSLKSENSRNKLQLPSSSNDSSSKKNNATTQSSADTMEQSTTSLTPSSLNLPALKFDLDGDLEVQSPDSSMWESFFSDQLDHGGDFMISSPVRNNNNINVPNNISPQAYPPYYNYAQGMQSQSLSGCSPPRFSSSSQIGSFNSSNNKGKGLSPLHRVFNSPNNQYMQHVENLSLPAIEEFLEEYQGDINHGYSSSSITNNKVSCSDNNDIGTTSSDCFDMQTPIGSILDSLAMNNSSSSQLSQESDMFHHHMGSMASASLSQALQQERYQEKQHKHQLLQQQQQLQQQSLTVPLPIGMDQVVKSFLCQGLIQIIN